MEKRKFYKASREYVLDNRENFFINEGWFYSKPGDWFEDKEVAAAHFVAARRIAYQKADEICRELKDLQEKLGFIISYNYSGDTYGIYDEYQYIYIKTSDYNFIYKLKE